MRASGRNHMGTRPQYLVALLICLSMELVRFGCAFPLAAFTRRVDLRPKLASSSASRRNTLYSIAEPSSSSASSASSSSSTPDSDAGVAVNKTSSEIAFQSVLLPQPGERSSSPSNSSPIKWKRVVVPRPKTGFALQDHISRHDKMLLAGGGLASAVFFWVLLTMSGPNTWRYFLAGGICAATSHAIPVPIDVIKTRKQVDYKLSNCRFLEVARILIKQEGVGSLFGGLGPTLVGYLIEGAIKFGTYEALKPIVSRLFLGLSGLSPLLRGFQSQLASFVVCASLSGFCASIMLCPMEAIRIRQVAHSESFQHGWVKGGYAMLQQEGVATMYKGFSPMLYKQIPYTITKNVSFDIMTKTAYAVLLNGGHVLTHAIKVQVPLLAAVVASVLSCVSSQPGDMLLSLVNANEGENRNTHEIARDILRSERGFRGFFVGIQTRFYHVGIIVTLQLLIYDVVKRLCGIAATGT